MTDMKVFTIRDLDRTPRKVLDSSIREGRALVQGRSGEKFLITPVIDGEASASDEEVGCRWLEKHRSWLASHSRKPVPKSQVAEVDRLLGGS